MVQTSTVLVTASIAAVAAGIIGEQAIHLSPLPPLSSTPQEKRLLTIRHCFLPLLIGYAAYFDYQRRSHSHFRRNLRRNERRQYRAEKEEAEASVHRQRQIVKISVDEAKDEGFPSSVEEREAYFNEQVTLGEMLSPDRKYFRSGWKSPSLFLSLLLESSWRWRMKSRSRFFCSF